MTVTDDLCFAESSLNERLVTQSEEDALRLLGVNVETIDATRLVGTYTSRIAKNDEEFLLTKRKAYRRSKKSCKLHSSVLYVITERISLRRDSRICKHQKCACCICETFSKRCIKYVPKCDSCTKP